MKTRKIYLVVHNIHVEKAPDTRKVEGVFFNKQNARWFARQLMQENKTVNWRLYFSIKKYEFPDNTSNLKK